MSIQNWIYKNCMNILISKVHSNLKHEFDVPQMLICEIFEALGIFGSDSPTGAQGEGISCVFSCMRACMCLRVILFKIIVKMSSSSILKSPGGF